MVYVFLVDAGIMLTFDVSYALKSVSHLAQAIEEECNIPVRKQVLIVSGGESLDPNRRACLYSAGTDTNPFFLFRRIDYDCAPPNYDVECSQDVDMREEVNRALQLPPSYETVEQRAQLAKHFCDLAINQTNICKQLVHEQHLQQQGWAASLANMDDCVNVVQHNLDFVERTVRKHVSKIDHYKNLLATFNEVLVKLSQVPLPQALLVGGGAFMEDLISSLRSAGKGNCTEELEETNSVQETKDEPSVQENEGTEEQTPEEPMVVSKKSGSNNSLSEDSENKVELEASLLQWIHHHDEKGTMKLLVDNCERGLRQFGEDLLKELKEERERLLADLAIPNVKEIKGLEERLYALEQFMQQAKTLVRTQSELSQSFTQNQNRCNHLGDASIFPDLCLQHSYQLALMLDNHCKIQDIRRRCTNAKTELCTSLFHRLKWIVYVESRIAQLSYKLNIMNEGLRRLDLNLELLSELHAAPQKYLMAVGEVVRRRTFSSAFLTWGQNLSSQMQSVYTEEMARRKEFDNNFEDHFVRLMFPGLDDCPIAFATEAPTPFDADLPKLSITDLEMIRSKLPDVAKVVPAPEISDTMNHLMRILSSCGQPANKERQSDSENKHRGDGQTDPETGVQPVKMRRLVSALSSVPQLKDDRGFESETDIEEFEKVGQSPVDLAFDDRQARAPSSASGNTVEGLTPVPMEDTRVNMQQMGEAAAALTRLLRSDLAELRQLVAVESRAVPAKLNEFRASWQLLLAFFNDLPSVQPKSKETDVDKSMSDTITPSSDEKDARIAELEKLVEEHVQNERELREQLLQRDAKDDDFKRVTGELERRLEDVEKYRARCDELQRRLDTNLERHHRDSATQPQLLDEANFQAQVQRLEEEKRLLADLAARANNDKENLVREFEKMKQSLVEAEDRKNSALKEQAAKLQQEHRAEVANIRSRFKLMTSASMEKSPSETSLEAEKPDFSEMSREEIIARIREEMSKDRDARVREAIRRTKREMEIKNKSEFMLMKMEAEKQVSVPDTLRRVIIEKEQQIASLIEREAQLKAEWNRLRKTLHSFSERDYPAFGMLGGNVQLRCTSSVEGTLTPTPLPETSQLYNLTRSSCALIEQGKITTSSCNIDDIVLVVWNEAHAYYMVVQQKDILVFVHQDSLPALGLSIARGTPLLNCVGRVTEREYCHAKKSVNRFRVERGAKFYRVKLAPIHIDALKTTATQCNTEASVTILEASPSTSSQSSVTGMVSGPQMAISDDNPVQGSSEMPS